MRRALQIVRGNVERRFVNAFGLVRADDDNAANSEEKGPIHWVNKFDRRRSFN